jgi:ABC-type lipoprotein release transport system permease subunit
MKCTQTGAPKSAALGVLCHYYLNTLKEIGQSFTDDCLSVLYHFPIALSVLYHFTIALSVLHHFAIVCPSTFLSNIS